jgi:DNA-binding response OmpR family regulator
MLPAFISFRCPSILSVTVRRSPKRLALVVTASPAIARAVSSYLQTSDRGVTVIWFPSLVDACRRLEGVHASMVIVDEAVPGASGAVTALHAADPEADILLLADGLAES